MNHLVVSPAYGRDYKSKKEVLEAWNSNKDFIIENVMDHYCGKPINKEDFEKTTYKSVELRYKNKTQSTYILRK